MRRPDAPLSCVRARVLLDAYLDGELRGVRRTQMDRHLGGCHACAQEMLRARQVRTALRALPAAECSDTVMAAVRARIGAPDPVTAGREREAELVEAAGDIRPAVHAAAAPPAAAARRRPAPWWERVAHWLGANPVVWRPAIIAASIAVVAFGGYMLFHRPPTDIPVNEAEALRAQRQMRWVLAKLGQINAETANTVRTEVFEKRVGEPTARAVNNAIENSVRQ